MPKKNPKLPFAGSILAIPCTPLAVLTTSSTVALPVMVAVANDCADISSVAAQSSEFVNDKLTISQRYRPTVDDFTNRSVDSDPTLFVWFDDPVWHSFILNFVA